MVREKAQVVLETCLIFVLSILFLFGLIRIWMWFNVDMARRSQAFNSTRVAVATEVDDYVYGNGSDKLLLRDYYFSRPSITEDWVLKGVN